MRRLDFATGILRPIRKVFSQGCDMVKILNCRIILRYFIQFSGALAPAPPKNPETKRGNSYFALVLFLDSSGVRGPTPQKTE